MARRKKVELSCNLETELALLYEISTLVQLSPSNNKTFEQILELVNKVVDFRAASLFLIEMETGMLTEVAKLGRSTDLISFVRFDKGMGLSGWVAKEKRPIILNNLRKSHGNIHTKSFMSVPIIFKDELIGVINFAHDQPDAFTQRDMQIVGIIAAEIAVTIERVVYEYLLEKKDTELRETSEKLRQVQMKLVEFEKKQTEADVAVTLNHKISNPLAIIAGNAQFLLMTMKNANPSVIKRLKAIDEGALAIAQITEKFKQLDSLAVENYVKGYPKKTINLKKPAKVSQRC